MPENSTVQLLSADLHITQILQALREAPDAEGVHQARVLIKKLRARLRLAEAVLPEFDAGSIDEELKGLGKALSRHRDNEVARVTLQGLRKQTRSKKLVNAIDAIIVYLNASGAPTAEEAQHVSERVNNVLAQLDVFAQLEVEQHRVMQYLQDQLLDCCDAGDAALHRQKCKPLHAWRKQVKALVYQLQLLPTPARKITALAKLLDKLGKRLGDVHDDCFIQDLVAALPPEVISPPDRAKLDKLLSKDKVRQCRKAAKLQRRICQSGLVHFKVRETHTPA